MSRDRPTMKEIAESTRARAENRAPKKSRSQKKDDRKHAQANRLGRQGWDHPKSTWW